MMQQLPILSPEIRESAQELQHLLQQQNHLEDRDKVAALYLLKLGRIDNFADLAKTIGQELPTLEVWFQVYRDRGLLGLLQLPVQS